MAVRFPFAFAGLVCALFLPLTSARRHSAKRRTISHVQGRSSAFSRRAATSETLRADGTPPADPSRFEATKTLLGQGSFGEIYLGKDLSNGKQVAIKYLVMTDTAGYTGRIKIRNLMPAVAAEAGHECSMARKLVTRVPDGAKKYFIDCLAGLPEDPDEQAVMVFEYAGTSTMAEFYWGGGDAGNAAAARRELMTELTRAIAALGTADFSHHDLKFDNVMVNGDNVRVIDYGAMVDLQSLPRDGVDTTAWAPHAAWWTRNPRHVGTPAEGRAYDAHALGLMWLMSEIFPSPQKMSLVSDMLKGILSDVNEFARRDGTHPTRSAEALQDAVNKKIKYYANPLWFKWWTPGLFTMPPREVFDFVVLLLKEHPEPIAQILNHTSFVAVTAIGRK